MLLLAAAILVVAITVYFTLAVRPEDLPAAEPVSPTQHLEQRKAAIYENLRDLQFEYRVGKLSDTDYQQTKLILQKELAAVLGQIEQVLAPAVTTRAPAVTGGAGGGRAGGGGWGEGGVGGGGGGESEVCA